MKISYNWLKDYLSTSLNIKELAELLTDIGLEVEGTEKVGITKEDLEGFVVGKVLSCEPHPNADKLKVTRVELQDGQIEQIVCGAPNIAEGLTVPVATIGTVIKDDKGNSFKIKKAKLRGEASHGMICSQKELRVSEDNSGIWAMPDKYAAGTPLSEILNTENDVVLEIGLTPNRSDAMSHYGVARDAAAAINSRGRQAQLKEIETSPLPSDKENPFSVKIEADDACRHFCGAYIKGVEVKGSPQWLKSRLTAIGIQPKNNVVDATNYFLHSLGQPLHAYDADKISGDHLIVRKAKENEKLHTLDDVDRTLNAEDLLITDKEKVLGLAGVMGGKESAVSPSTQNIYLESAYFDAVSIRKSAKRHTINSDASFRFERGVDPNFVKLALERCAALILELGGGSLQGEITEVKTKELKPEQVKLRFKKLTQLIGFEIPTPTIKTILAHLDIQIVEENEDFLQLSIPLYRVDVTREADVIEEVLRIYGYNNIPVHSKIHTSIVPGEGYLNEQLTQKFTHLLVNKGFYEVMNLSFYKEEYNELLNLPKENTIEVLNALSRDLGVLRRSMLPGLLTNIAYNINRKNTDLKFFELGQVYSKNQESYTEKRMAALALTGKQETQQWNYPDQSVSFFYLKGICQQILQFFGISDYEEIAIEDIQGEGLSLSIGKKELVRIYRLDKKLLKSFDVEQPVFYAAFYFTELLDFYAKKEGVKFQEISKYPEVKRDLALLVDKDVHYAAIKAAITKSIGEYLTNCTLFDVYEGDKLPENKKSYAIGLSLLNKNKTMTDKEIDALIANALNALKKQTGAELRK